MAASATLTLLFTISFFISPAISTGGSRPTATIKAWCRQTPHPQPCEYFMMQNPKYDMLPIKSKSDFFKLSAELALDRCMHAQSNIKSLGSKCRSPSEKAAWADCVELYDDIIHRINQTVGSRFTQEDAQTWLSCALTNLETCRAGFTDFGITDFVMPLVMGNNVSQLLSNTLALNRAAGGGSGGGAGVRGNGFPSWVVPGDRRLLQSPEAAMRADLVVAQDGSGDFKTVGEAVAAVPGRRKGSGRFVIHVKEDTYGENVDIGKSLKNIMLLGDGIGKTIITGSRSVGGGSTTFKSATVAVVGDGFIARGITFRNTAGAGNHQAVALRSGADQSVFYLCSFEGYQDTLYVHCQRQFYRQCDIYGTVDFIFGNAAVVIQNCNIYPRYPANKTNTITAQGRTDPNQNTGISIHNSRITATSDLKSAQGSVRTYLGRPWKEYSSTVFMKTNMDSLIDPAGWLLWSGNFALNTLYYGEYMNTGPGSSTAKRVNWNGYHVITSASEAANFTPGSFIAADSWLPATGVPYTSGL